VRWRAPDKHLLPGARGLRAAALAAFRAPCLLAVGENELHDDLVFRMGRGEDNGSAVLAVSHSSCTV
jgi:hypothetical protein